MNRRKKNDRLVIVIVAALFAFAIGVVVWLQTPPVPLEIFGKPIVATWSGECVGVHDGDSIRVLNPDNESIPIRLEGIDAPELKQAFGRDAKTALSGLVFGRDVIVHETGTDFFKRTLAVVVVDGANANESMIRNGHAWHYEKYNDSDRLANLQREAKANLDGLWSDMVRPVPPWD